MYVTRYLEHTVLSALQNRPVVIIEGARSVGKTRMLKALHDQGALNSVVSLADPVTRQAATHSPDAWLRSLAAPFAIDEAQLVPDLSVAIKRALDETQENLRCVLTGSAAIGKTGFGGSDPLARRAVRLAMEPLTESELLGEPPWSVVDEMFHGAPRAGSDHTDIPWQRTVIAGGLPRYRLQGSAVPRLRAEILQDISAILTDDVLPGEKFDQRLARDVVYHVLRNPSGELKATAIGNSLGIDSRTVNRYLDVAERRFLINEQPNLRRPLKAAARTTAKAYPADVALSAALLTRHSTDFDDPTVRGGLVESLVAQQLRAHLGWSEPGTELLCWREAIHGRMTEVDLVLQDVQGRLVGIEVKAAEKVKGEYLQSLRAMRAKYGEKFHRGYTITTGRTAAIFEDNLWMLPLSAMVTRSSWLPR